MNRTAPANNNTRQRRSTPPDHGGFWHTGAWLAEAAAAEGEERAAAFKVADDLRERPSLSRGDLMNGQDAA